MQERLYYHSPFSEKSIYTQKDRALLLSFALSELFSCVSELSKNWTLPLPSLKERAYDAPLNKLQEHTSLLLIAFPDHKESLFKLKENISHLVYFLEREIPCSPPDLLKALFPFLEPLVKECQQDENFLFFLLSHQEKLSYFLDSSYLPSLLQEFYPEGLSNLQTLLCDYFHKKGFTGLIPEITLLLQQLPQRDFAL